MTFGGVALVAAGGAVGSVARYALGVLMLRALGSGFPWGTLAVNVAGSVVIGVIAGLAAGGGGLTEPGRLFLVTGVLGGFTTFSAFSLDTGALFGRSAGLAALYVGVTVAAGLGAFAAGHAVGMGRGA